MVNMGFLKNVTWDGEGECYSEGGFLNAVGRGEVGDRGKVYFR